MPGHKALGVEILALALAAVPGRLLATGLLDQDTADRLDSGGEEVTAAVELLVANESPVRLVNEGRCVERLVRILPGESGGGGEGAKLLVDQRQ